MPEWPAPVDGPLHDCAKKDLARYVARAMRVVEECLAKGSDVQPPADHCVIALPKLSSRTIPRVQVEDYYRAYHAWYLGLSEVQHAVLCLTLAPPPRDVLPPPDERSWSRWQHPQSCFKEVFGQRMDMAQKERRNDLGLREVEMRQQVDKAEAQARAAWNLDQVTSRFSVMEMCRWNAREAERQKAFAARVDNIVREEDTEARKADELTRQRLIPSRGGLRWEVRDFPFLQSSMFADQRQEVEDEETAWRAAFFAEERTRRKGFKHYEHQSSPPRASRRFGEGQY
eukprot:Hpha_TRINITY_DN14673_c0_g1::TRINITY_DN14673_c0_g1_i1::g.48468::m.48468